MIFFSRFMFLLFLSGAAYAQTTTDYSLNEGAVHFKGPSDWSMILQKDDGNPQVLAFQVRDPADQGTDTATRVTVETRRINENVDFTNLVASGEAKAMQLNGYTEETGTHVPNTLRYTGMDLGTRYQYRETFLLKGKLAVHVRCVRPLLAATTAAWTAAYERGCDLIVSSLK